MRLPIGGLRVDNGSTRNALKWHFLTVSTIVAALGLIASSAAAHAATAPRDAVSSSCPAGSKPAVIAGNFKCLHVGQRCKARYQQAYHRYRFQCVNGRLRRWSPPPPPPPEEPPTPPPTPAPPPARPGHYKGITSQNELIEFDVIDAGNPSACQLATVCVTNLHTGQVNQSCTPPFNLYWGYIDFGSYKIPVNYDGSFGVESSGPGTVGTVAANGYVKVTGSFSASLAAGTLERKTEFTWTDGVHYSCGAAPSWTATRTFT